MPERQRILWVMESLGVGGAEVAAIDLLRELSARGHSAEVVTLWGPYALEPALEEAGIPVWHLRLGHRWRLDQGVRRLTRRLRINRPTVVHGQLFFPGVYVALSCAIVRVPARVVTFQNLGYESYPAETPWLKIRKCIDRSAMRHAIDGHIAVSEAVNRHYSTHLRLAPMQVIPNGIPARAIAAADGPQRESISARYGLQENRLLVVCPARFVHEKGHRYLIEAVGQLRAAGVTPNVILAGDGPLRAEIAELVRAATLGSVIQLPGVVPHDEVLDLMRAADIVVLPSTHEGFPVAAAEAAATGTAVVASDVGGLPDLFDGDAGILVPPRDPGALAAALRRVIEDEALRLSLGRRAQERTLRTCDIEQVANLHETLYEKLLQGS